MPKNAALFTSNRSDWETPQALFDRLDAIFHFGLDAAASVENTKRDLFLSEAENALVQSWNSITSDPVWLNPPYGAGLIKWVLKAADEGRKVTVVVLLPARTETRYLEIVWKEARAALFFKGRLTFVGAKDNAPFPSVIAVFSPRDWTDEMNSLSDLGAVLTRGDGEIGADA